MGNDSKWILKVYPISMLLVTVRLCPVANQNFDWWDHWPSQEPKKLEVPTIYKAYMLGLCKGISPENMALYGTVPPLGNTHTSTRFHL